MKHRISRYGLSLRTAAVSHVTHAVDHAIAVIREQQRAIRCDRVAHQPSVFSLWRYETRRERFDRQKVLSGLLRACEKRPVPASKLEAIVDATESFLMDAPERERTTSEVGELIMTHLKGIDTVAYIRFASVYRDFKDVREFKEELEQLLTHHGEKKKGSK